MCDGVFENIWIIAYLSSSGLLYLQRKRCIWLRMCSKFSLYISLKIALSNLSCLRASGSMTKEYFSVLFISQFIYFKISFSFQKIRNTDVFCFQTTTISAHYVELLKHFTSGALHKVFIELWKYIRNNAYQCEWKEELSSDIEINMITCFKRVYGWDLKNHSMTCWPQNEQIKMEHHESVSKNHEQKKLLVTGRVYCVQINLILCDLI